LKNYQTARVKKEDASAEGFSPAGKPTSPTPKSP
jgi:hypothetical protein